MPPMAGRDDASHDKRSPGALAGASGAMHSKSGSFAQNHNTNCHIAERNSAATAADHPEPASVLDAVVSLWLAMEAGGPRFTRVLSATLRGTLTREQRCILLMAATMAAELDDAQEVGAAILRAKEAAE